MREKVVVKVSLKDFEQIKKIIRKEKIELEYKVVKGLEGIEAGDILTPKELAHIKNEYQLKSSRYYLGSDYLYRENLYFIRQYPEYEKLLQSGGDLTQGDGYDSIRSGKIGKPTESKALHTIKLDEISKKKQIIDEAIETIPEVYRQGVFDHVVYKATYSDKIYLYANINTWKRWTQKFVYEVAIRRGQRSIIEQLKNIE